ncbi:hypothetical protein TrVE_jg2558 [Triparma verrucosa]|uniref:Uncharacterized protein n=2 Tax=Triparma TaxID=722752 RepID=A0A9W7BHG6_9STRA|nr:hypothetical protein TrST_g1738 [Triparma strigata]GMI13093.1 hypothetical protein TrVE_jg2558 [Triparma verrucosa]
MASRALPTRPTGSKGSLDVSLSFQNNPSSQPQQAPRSTFVTSSPSFTSPTPLPPPTTAPKISPMSSEKLFSMDRANDVINSLVSTVNSQGQQIAMLVQQQKLGVERSELSKVVTSLTQSIRGLENRVAKLEENISLTSPVPDSIGHVVSSSRRAIMRSLDNSSEKVSFKDLEKVESSLLDSIKVAVTQSASTCASKQTMEKAVDVVTSMSDKLRAVEGHLSNKVDLADFEAIRLDAQVVREKARGLNVVESRLKEIEMWCRETTPRLEGVEEGCVGNANRLAIVSHQVEERVKEADFRVAEKSLSKLTKQAATLAERQDLSRVEDVLTMCVRKLENYDATLAQQAKGLDTTQTELYSLSADVVKKGEWKKWLSESGVGKFDNTVRNLRLELDAKAWAKDHKNTQQTVQRLLSDFKPVQIKANLSADFVSWYSKKGEAFEGNLNTLDRHLEQLVVDGRVVD